MTSSELKIKIPKTYKMEAWPVDHFYCHSSPTGAMVPDKTAVANITNIPVSPCVATESVDMHVRQLGSQVENVKTSTWVPLPNYFSFFLPVSSSSETLLATFWLPGFFTNYRYTWEEKDFMFLQPLTPFLHFGSYYWNQLLRLLNDRRCV